MPSGLAILLAVAAGLAALGLWLWLWAARRQERLAAVRHLEQHLQTDGLAGAGMELQFGAPEFAAIPEPPAPPSRSSRIGNVLPEWLTSAVPPRAIAGGAAAGLLAVAAAAAAFDPLVAAILAVLLTLFGIFAIWLRLQKLRQRIVAQLPGMLDAMVRLITIGNSMQAAFQQAVPTTKPPLRGFMDNASSLAKAGVDLDQALLQVARQTQVEEMHLFSAIVGLGLRYGGRSDQLLERVAAFMRDREQAEGELNALSAETRLSAWVLGLLPMAVGGLIIMVNASYFMTMWSDPSGRQMALGALGLQVFGAALLYRLARLET